MRTVPTVLGAAAAALVLAPVPAFARPPETEMGAMADKLSDPALQGRMAATLAALSEAMLNIRMAPFAKAMRDMGDAKAARDIDEHTTLGDLAGPDARKMPREMARKVPAMMGAMAGMAGAMEQMLPEFAKIAETMKDAAERGRVEQGGDWQSEPAAGEATEG